MKHIGVFLLILCGMMAAGRSGCAQQQKVALIINRSTEDNIHPYYYNVLLKKQGKTIRPGDTLRVVFDENSFTSNAIRFALDAEDITRKKPVLIVLPGDVVSVRHVRKTNFFSFTGNQPAELRFCERVWRSPVEMEGAHSIEPEQLPATLEAYMGFWQNLRQTSDSLVTELRATPGIRPAVAVAITRALRLKAFQLLLRGAVYHELLYKTDEDDTPGSLAKVIKAGLVRSFPVIYRDSVLAQARVLRSVYNLPAAESEMLMHALRAFSVYVALSQGRVPNYSAQYVVAKREYRGVQREWACYALMHATKDRRRPISLMLKDYRTWVMPESRFVRSLTGQDQLTQVMPGQLLANTDVLTRPDGSTRTLAEMLTQHKGKVIYLDIWASWCAPCVQEMPASAALRRHYQGKNVVVVYLSIDEDHQKWQQASARLLPQVPEQYRFVNQKASRFLKRFTVSSIPRYILLDKYGIMRYAEALRPDDAELKTHVATFLAC